MEEIVYLNGKLKPLVEAKIGVMDYGFLYGYGLFETMRAYNGVIFRMENHLKRIAAAAQLLKIPVKMLELRSALIKTLQVNLLKEARIRLAISIGEGSLVPDLRSCHQPTVFVAATFYEPYSQEK
jgi:branched-chain amino acid aminotransferase